MSRDAVLARIRSALSTPAASHPARPAPAVTPLPPRPGSLVERFGERFRELGGGWHEARDAAQAADTIGALSATAPDRPLWVARDRGGLLDRLELADRLRSRGCAVVRRWDGIADPDRPGIAVTGATVAVAESGTLGLVAEAEQGRLASVVTPVHVALLTPDQIVATLAEALERFEAILGRGESSAAMLITGPSRTADIEGQLVVGVHGPAEVHCMLML